MNVIDRLKSHMKEHNLKLPKVAEDTGLPYDRMYKWLNAGNRPSADDTKTLEDYLSGKLSTSEHEQFAHRALPGNENILTVRSLARSIELNAESRKIEARNVERLIALLELKHGLPIGAEPPTESFNLDEKNRTRKD